MEGILTKFTELLAAHPAPAAMTVVAVLFATLVWAVLASSYRYR